MTVESALVFPIVVAIMFGIIDAGRFIATRVMLTQAAAAGARTACLSSSTGAAAVTTAVRGAATMLSSSITVPTPACTVPPATDCTATWPKAPGSTVAVTVQYTFTAGFFPAFSKSMTNTSRIVCIN